MPQTINQDFADDIIGEPYYISTAGTYIIKPTAGALVRLLLGGSDACTITVYDGEDIVACITMTKDTSAAFEAGLRFYTNLKVVTSADFDLTVVYV